MGCKALRVKEYGVLGKKTTGTRVKKMCHQGFTAVEDAVARLLGGSLVQ